MAGAKADGGPGRFASPLSIMAWVERPAARCAIRALRRALFRPAYVERGRTIFPLTLENL